MTPVERTLQVLCQHYARDGQPHVMNDVQVTIYAEELARFSDPQLQSAAREWMRKSRFFPAISDLLSVLEPEPDWPALANSSWNYACKFAKHYGAYANVEFADAPIGAAVRDVFGSWEKFCRMEQDGPAWAIRRQTWLAVFRKTVDDWGGDNPVRLRGDCASDAPYMSIPSTCDLPVPSDRPDRLPGHADAKAILAEVSRRFDSAKALPLSKT